MAEFDWMPLERLNKLTAALRECDESCGAGTRFSAPPTSEKEFWSELRATLFEDEDDSDEDDTEALANDVHAELNADGYIQCCDQVGVGDLGTAESRLLLRLRGVRVRRGRPLYAHAPRARLSGAADGPRVC